MQFQQKHVGWHLWALWTGATVTGSVLAFPLGWELEFFRTPAKFVNLLYVTVGIFVGMAQWLVLRLYLSRSGWWPVATAAALSTLVVLVGPLQWLVLRRHLPKAGWWTLTSTLVWLFAMAVGVRIVLALPHLGWAWSGMSLLVLAGFITGTLVGALTGLHLVKLLRRPISVC